MCLVCEILTVELKKKEHNENCVIADAKDM